MAVATFAGPLLVLPFSKSLVPVVATLVAGRIAAWAAHLLVCLRVLPEFGRSIGWDGSAIGPLLRFGGWMTVTNVAGPLMVTLDRFLIGALVSMTAVAYYAIPYEVVTKSLLLPGALMAVMFPAFSLFPIMLSTVALAQDGLKLWLGAEFAKHSFRVLQWLAGGRFPQQPRACAFHTPAGCGETGPNRHAASHRASVVSGPVVVADQHAGY